MKQKKPRRTKPSKPGGEIAELKAVGEFKIRYGITAKIENSDLVIHFIARSTDPDNPTNPDGSVRYSEIPRILRQPIPLDWLQASEADMYVIAENMVRHYHAELGEALRYEAGLHLLDTVITSLLNRGSLPMSKKAAHKRLMEIRTNESRGRLERLIGVRPGRRGRPPKEQNRSTVLAEDIIRAMRAVRPERRTMTIIAKSLKTTKPALQKRVTRGELNWKHLQEFAAQLPPS